jgi:hypothetical protein
MAFFIIVEYVPGPLSRLHDLHSGFIGHRESIIDVPELPHDHAASAGFNVETMVRHASEHDVMVIAGNGQSGCETSHVLYLRSS